jgi:hypothetical protein
MFTILNKILQNKINDKGELSKKRKKREYSLQQDIFTLAMKKKREECILRDKKTYGKKRFIRFSNKAILINCSSLSDSGKQI